MTKICKRPCLQSLYMVLLAPFVSVSHNSSVFTLIILSHTPKYGNQQKTCSISSLLSEAEEGGKQGSPLQPLLTTMCDTVLEVHFAPPVMLFTIQGRRGHLLVLLSASHLVKLDECLGKSVNKQKKAWTSQCLPAFSGEWRHCLASKCLLISCWWLMDNLVGVKELPAPEKKILMMLEVNSLWSLNWNVAFLAHN